MALAVQPLLAISQAVQWPFPRRLGACSLRVTGASPRRVPTGFSIAGDYRVPTLCSWWHIQNMHHFHVGHVHSKTTLQQRRPPSGAALHSLGALWTLRFDGPNCMSFTWLHEQNLAAVCGDHPSRKCVLVFWCAESQRNFSH